MNITDRDTLVQALTYHPPTDQQKQHYEELRHFALEYGAAILANCPSSRERSLALTKLQEARMWANAAIAVNAGGDQGSVPPQGAQP